MNHRNTYQGEPTRARIRPQDAQPSRQGNVRGALVHLQTAAAHTREMAAAYRRRGSHAAAASAIAFHADLLAAARTLRWTVLP